MPKLTNLVRAGALVWYRQGESFRSAEYRGKTVDGLHEIMIINPVEDRPDELKAVRKDEILVSGELVLN